MMTMNNVEIAGKAINKALKQGFDLKEFGLEKGMKVFTASRAITSDVLFYILEGENVIFKYDIEKIIFSHSFATAFWGYDSEWSYITVNHQSKRCVDYKTIKAWEYHLTKMILEGNPIEYLKKFI